MQLDDGKERMVSPNMEQSPPGAIAEASQDEYVLSVVDILGVLWRRLWVIALVAAVCVGYAVGSDLLQPSIYQASIKILVGQEEVRGETPIPADLLALQDVTQTVAEVLHTTPVARETIQRLDLQEEYEYPEDLLGGLKAEPVPATQVIVVSYEDPSPEEAQRIVNTVGDVFSDQMSEEGASTGAITATVWEEAGLPDSPVSPDPWRDGLLALVVGSILGVGLALLLEYLANPWRSPEELERISGVPTFGVIREFKGSKSKNLKEAMKETIAEEERNGTRDDQEARMWAEKLAEVDSKHPRYQAMAAEGLISSEELRAKLAELEDTREEAEREMARMWAEKLAEVDSKRSRFQDMAAEELISLEELRAKLAELEEETREVVAARREMNGGY